MILYDGGESGCTRYSRELGLLGREKPKFIQEGLAGGVAPSVFHTITPTGIVKSKCVYCLSFTKASVPVIAKKKKKKTPIGPSGNISEISQEIKVKEKKIRNVRI